MTLEELFWAAASAVQQVRLEVKGQNIYDRKQNEKKMQI